MSHPPTATGAVASGASSNSSADSRNPDGVYDLTAMYPNITMSEYFLTLAEYARSMEGAPSSPFTFPPPQRTDDPDDPPVWPKWDAQIPDSRCDTRGSDIYGEGAHLNHFENHVANLFGKESGMFCVTGCMAQMIALRLHAQGRNQIFGAHPTCHMLLHQDRAFEVLMGFSVVHVCPAHRCMTAADVEAAFSKHWKQPCALVIELPDREIGGQAVAWEELVKIREFTAKKGIKLHLDGARLWEIQVYYRRSFQEIASLFDSVYISFYKGLQGQSSGAMLLGSKEFIADARVWQVRFGGRLFHSFPLSIAAERALNTNNNNKGALERRWKKMQTLVQGIMNLQKEFVQSKERDVSLGPFVSEWKKKFLSEWNKKIKATITDKEVNKDKEESAASSSSSSASATTTPSPPPFTPFIYFNPGVPQCSMVHAYVMCGPEAANAIRDQIQKETTAVGKPIRLFGALRGASKKEGYFEWKIGTANLEIADDIYYEGWKKFMEIRFQQLLAQQK